MLTPFPASSSRSFSPLAISLSQICPHRAACPADIWQRRGHTRQIVPDIPLLLPGHIRGSLSTKTVFPVRIKHPHFPVPPPLQNTAVPIHSPLQHRCLRCTLQQDGTATCHRNFPPVASSALPPAQDTPYLLAAHASSSILDLPAFLRVVLTQLADQSPAHPDTVPRWLPAESVP